MSAIQDLIKKVDEQGEEIKELKRTSNISVGGTTTTELSTSNHRNITHAGMFPHIRAVTPSQRQNIIEGKYINLASLLLDNETIQELKQVDSEGTTMYVKPRDVRLHLDLSIQEFIEAFTIYKKLFFAKQVIEAENLICICKTLLIFHQNIKETFSISITKPSL